MNETSKYDYEQEGHAFKTVKAKKDKINYECMEELYNYLRFSTK